MRGKGAEVVKRTPKMVGSGDLGTECGATAAETMAGPATYWCALSADVTVGPTLIGVSVQWSPHPLSRSPTVAVDGAP